MYALVEIKGKQYKAEKGTVLKVDRIDGEKGDSVDFNNVMLFSDETIQVGSPYVTGVTVKATIEDHGKGRKVLVYKYKRRKGYEKKQGHRQHFSILRVEEITAV